MGTLNPTQHIIDVVRDITERKYQLPSIQRPFVWEEDQCDHPEPAGLGVQALVFRMGWSSDL